MCAVCPKQQAANSAGVRCGKRPAAHTSNSEYIVILEASSIEETYLGFLQHVDEQLGYGLVALRLVYSPPGVNIAAVMYRNKYCDLLTDAVVGHTHRMDGSTRGGEIERIGTRVQSNARVQPQAAWRSQTGSPSEAPAMTRYLLRFPQPPDFP